MKLDKHVFDAVNFGPEPSRPDQPFDLAVIVATIESKTLLCAAQIPRCNKTLERTDVFKAIIELDHGAFCSVVFRHVHC